MTLASNEALDARYNTLPSQWTITMPLPERRERFIQEYVLDKNAAQAAILAGYSRNGARQIGRRLLTYADVAVEVRRRSRLVARKLSIDHETVIALLLEAVEVARRKEDPRAMVMAARELARFCALDGVCGAKQGHEDLRTTGEAAIDGLDEVPIEKLEDLVLGRGIEGGSPRMLRGRTEQEGS